MTSETTDYYNKNAAAYDLTHGEDQNPEHTRALELAWPMIGDVKSVLDVGCGTGRSIEWVSRQGAYDLFGVEPSADLMSIARAKVPLANIQQGHGEKLPMPDKSVDMVMATGIMHHVDSPAAVIREMFRVSRKMVLISDHNNFAFGGSMSRKLRLLLESIGMLGVATFVKQGFKKQGYSEDDGWWYPYSLLDDYALVSSHSSQVYIIPTRPSSLLIGNFLLAQSHLAFLAVKR